MKSEKLIVQSTQKMEKHYENQPKRWEETTIEVVVAVKAVIIVEAEEMEDSKAEETRAQLQAPNSQK